MKKFLLWSIVIILTVLCFIQCSQQADKPFRPVKRSPPQLAQEIRISDNAFTVEQCGLNAEENSYCFQIDVADPELNVRNNDTIRYLISLEQVKVMAADPCVEFEDNGIYQCDDKGRIYARVKTACVAVTDLTVTVGNIKRNFPINIVSRK